MRLGNECLVALRTVSSSQEGLRATAGEQAARWKQDAEIIQIHVMGLAK